MVKAQRQKKNAGESSQTQGLHPHPVHPTAQQLQLSLSHGSACQTPGLLQEAAGIYCGVFPFFFPFNFCSNFCPFSPPRLETSQEIPLGSVLTRNDLKINSAMDLGGGKARAHWDWGFGLVQGKDPVREVTPVPAPSPASGALQQLLVLTKNLIHAFNESFRVSKGK